MGQAWRSLRRGRLQPDYQHGQDTPTLWETEDLVEDKVIDAVEATDRMIADAILRGRHRGGSHPDMPGFRNVAVQSVAAVASSIVSRGPKTTATDPSTVQPPKLSAGTVTTALGPFGDVLRDVRRAGNGTNGAVFRASIADGDAELAIKAVPVGKRQRVLSEIAAMKAFGGGDFVTLFGIRKLLTADASATMDSPLSRPHVFFLMEAADSDLMNVLRSGKEVPMENKLRILVEMLRALAKMEEAGWVHRDIKPPNLLVFGDCFSEGGCDVKVTDFGEAAEVDSLSDDDVPDRAGSPFYIAPEVWAARGDQSKSDVWSAGMVAFELFAGSIPVALQKALPKDQPALVDHPFKDFVPKELDISEDPNFQKLLKSERDIAALIFSMLQKKPGKRPSASLALSVALQIAQARGVHVPEQTKVAPPLVELPSLVPSQ